MVPNAIEPPTCLLALVSLRKMIGGGGGVLLKKKLVERHFGQYDFILCEEQPPEWGSKGDKNVCKAAVLFPEQPI